MEWVELFHDGGPYHIETSPLIFRPNQWIGFYMIGTSTVKELTHYHKVNRNEDRNDERNVK